MTCASASARSSRSKARSRPTSSCRCRIPARRRRSASRSRPACPSSSASSATTMSAAPSSSRAIRSATWACKLKHNANRRMIEGKRVVLVDDSIVRGTTSQKIVQMVRDAGAKEVHMRIASPPTASSCFYGVDTPEKSKLLASRMSVEEMARVHPRRFARLPVDRRALPRRRRSRPRQRPAAILRRLLHRAISDPPADIEGSDNVRTLSLLATGGQ